jgi:hypothetical protein
MDLDEQDKQAEELLAQELASGFWESAEPLRVFIEEHPEFREPIIEVLGEALTQSFAGNFYAGMKP